MVLRRTEGQRVRSVAKSEKRELGALKVVLDHHRGAGCTEAAAEHEVDRVFGLRPRLRDHDPFAGREPVGLDHDGVRHRREMPLGGFGLVEPPVTGRRDGEIPCQLLGEALRALEPGCGLGRAEDRDPGGHQSIGDAGHERRLGTHHDEVDAILAREVHDGRSVVRVDGNVHAQRRRSGIARCDEEPIEPGACRYRTGQRVFATPGAEEKDIHGIGQGAVVPVTRPQDAAPAPSGMIRDGIEAGRRGGASDPVPLAAEPTSMPPRDPRRPSGGDRRPVRC